MMWHRNPIPPINRRELLQVLNLPENTAIVDGVYTKNQLRRGDLPESLPYDPASQKGLPSAAIAERSTSSRSP